MKRNKKVLLILALAVYLMLSIMQLQLIVRDAPTGMRTNEIISNSFLSILQQNPATYQRDNQFEVLLSYVQLVPATIPYSDEWLILRAFYHFIPRSIWKEKPYGISDFFERATRAGTGVTTFASSIVGDFYLCQGWIGVCIAGLLMGILARQFDSLIDMAKQSPAVLLVYSYGIAFLFGSIRSYQVIYEGWFVFVLIFYILRAIGRIDTEKPSQQGART